MHIKAGRAHCRYCLKTGKGGREMIFEDRTDAGRKLAERLLSYHSLKPIILAPPGGGVLVGFEVARALDAPLNIIPVRQICVPFDPEQALGAVADGEEPELAISNYMKTELRISDAYLQQENIRQVAEFERRRKLYLGNYSPIPIKGRVVIVVDDGIATGATMRAALRVVRRQEPTIIILAVPVAGKDAIADLQRDADAVICLSNPEEFRGLKEFYRDFPKVDDETMANLLRNPRVELSFSDPEPRPRYG